MPNFRGFHGSTIVVKDPKKKVLSNKALTKKVRAISNKMGQYEFATETLYNAVTLTAGTEDLNYFSTTAPQDEAYQVGYLIRWKALCSTAGGATLRVGIASDEIESDTDTTSLFSTNSVNSTTNAFVPVKFRKYHENIDITPIGYMYKDMLIALNNGEPKAGMFYINMHRRYNNNARGYEMLCSALADEADVLFSLSVESHIYKRDLSA